jgi:hypothetical protein
MAKPHHLAAPLQFTNPRELAAFFIARAVVAAIHFVMTPMLLTPLFRDLSPAAGEMLLEVATSSISFMTWAVTLPLFILLRSRVGGVPLVVAGRGRGDAMTSSTGELVAYVSAVLIVMVAVWVLNAFVPALLGIPWWQSGQMTWTAPVSLGVSAASAVVVFLIFIASRGRPPEVSIPEVFD